MAETITRTIRVTPEQWEQIEKIAKDREISANRLVVELAMEALDRREWPRTELDIQVAKAALFAAQVLRRDLIADGRTDEPDGILQFVSSLVPESAVASAPSPDSPPSRSDPKEGSA